eukprot:1138301-Pelagomonas_calceolata.AAC.6
MARCSCSQTHCCTARLCFALDDRKATEGTAAVFADPGSGWAISMTHCIYRTRHSSCDASRNS